MVYPKNFNKGSQTLYGAIAFVFVVAMSRNKHSGALHFSTEPKSRVVSHRGNSLNMLLVFISLQLQLISKGWWPQKVMSWMQTFSAGKNFYRTLYTTQA